MFPLMNNRQRNYLAQSALIKIAIYRKKQLLEQQRRLLIEANTNQSLSEFKQKLESRRRERPVRISNGCKTKPASSVLDELQRQELQEDASEPICLIISDISTESSKQEESVPKEPIGLLSSDISTELSETKRELKEAIQEQEELNTTLIAENQEIIKTFVEEMTISEENADELTLKVVNDE